MAHFSHYFFRYLSSPSLCCDLETIKAVNWNSYGACLFVSVLSGIISGLALLCCVMSSALTVVSSILFYSCFKQEGKWVHSNLTGSASQILLILPRNTTLTHFKIFAFVQCHFLKLIR